MVKEDKTIPASLGASALGIGPDPPGTYRGAWHGSGPLLETRRPDTGALLARVRTTLPAEAEGVVEAAAAAFELWRQVPAPRRGDLVRRMGIALRAQKPALARLVSEECGKIRAEAEGEVQEMIDMADFAQGLSRALGGRTLPSERAGHKIREEWHPLGVIGVITAFNFPVAVWAWNAFVAAVAGDAVVWKPSEKTPLCAIAVLRLLEPLLREEGVPGLFGLVTGGPELGAQLASDPRLPLISATGSCRMGRSVAEAVARRLGRSLLELGGNNAVVVLDDADLELAARAVVFGAVGTAGQRCTSTRRLILQEGIAAAFERRLVETYASVRHGSPLEDGVLLGPLIDEEAARAFEAAVRRARSEGGEVLCGGRRIPGPGFFVEPTIIRMPGQTDVVRQETFAPILYTLRARDLKAAIALQNGVAQGLSSSLFTSSLAAAEEFTSSAGSDCGIANVNVGTSGAEIGGAFGGEKETGGGREAGSDAWKAYLRRQTCTVNFSSELPLSQGVRFDLGGTDASPSP